MGPKKKKTNPTQQITKLLSSLLCSLFGFGLVEKNNQLLLLRAEVTHARKQTLSKWERVGKGGLGRGGREEEEGREGGKVYRNQKRKRKLKTNLMDITEPEFPAEVQNMRALE